MAKQKVNRVLGNQEPSIKREDGSIVKYNEGGSKGGFRPDPNTTVLGTMNNIMSKQHSGKE